MRSPEPRAAPLRLDIKHLVGATDRGQTFPIARNDFADASRNVEFRGPVYAPERNILFAITGPWRAQR